MRVLYSSDVRTMWANLAFDLHSLCEKHGTTVEAVLALTDPVTGPLADDLQAIRRARGYSALDPIDPIDDINQDVAGVVWHYGDGDGSPSWVSGA